MADIDLATLPACMTDLPRDHAGRPVPWFVAFIDGVPDFRVVEGGKLQSALRGSLCWVCGRGFAGGEDRAWLIGPMCAVNLVTAEPPSHLDCAVWSARSCPFLATPNMVRRERHMPEGAVNPAGIMIRRNPGASVVWVTGYRAWETVREDDGGYLFRLGPAKRALWFAEGRAASRAEVLASINSGLPLLREMAEKDGPEAVAELEMMHAAALERIPQETLRVPNPGSDDALAQGCLCAVLDNHHGREAPYPPDGWYITGGCPLHAPPGMHGEAGRA